MEPENTMSKPQRRSSHWHGGFSGFSQPENEMETKIKLCVHAQEYCIQRVLQSWKSLSLLKSIFLRHVWHKEEYRIVEFECGCGHIFHDVEFRKRQS